MLEFNVACGLGLMHLHCIRLRVAVSYVSAVLQEGIEQFLNCLRILDQILW